VRAPTVHQYGEQAIWTPRAISVQGPNPGTWVSGDHVAAASGTVSSDTGALAAGDYEIRARYGGNDNGGWPDEFQWRNAANSANNQVYVCGANRVQNDIYIPRLTVATSERFRWQLQGAHTAGTHTSTGIWYRRVY